MAPDKSITREEIDSLTLRVDNLCEETMKVLNGTQNKIKTGDTTAVEIVVFSCVYATFVSLSAALSALQRCANQLDKVAE